MKYLLLTLLILSLFLEGVIFSLPLVFILSLIILIFYPEKKIYFFVFIVDLLIDSLRVVGFGITPLAVFLFFLTFKMYENTFAVRDYKLLILQVCVSALVYGRFAEYYFSFLLYALNVLAILLLVHFVFLKVVDKGDRKGSGVFLKNKLN